MSHYVTGSFWLVCGVQGAVAVGGVPGREVCSLTNRRAEHGNRRWRWVVSTASSTSIPSLMVSGLSSAASSANERRERSAGPLGPSGQSEIEKECRERWQERWQELVVGKRLMHRQRRRS